MICTLLLFFSLSLSLFKVDNEFETVATQLLKRTQAMLNKYRCLLLEDAMVKFHYQACLFLKLHRSQLLIQREKLQEITFSQHSLKGTDT